MAGNQAGVSTEFLKPIALAAAVVLGILAMRAQAAMDAHRMAVEHEVKATFVVNFARYVDWAPGTPQADPRNPVCIGVLGKGPFKRAMEAAAQGVRVRGRPIVVEHFGAAGRATGCNVVFVSDSEAHRAGEIVPSLNRTGVLTVSDSAAIARQGAIITLANEDDRVRFSVNLAEARRGGLTIGSQLLRLALRVEGKP
jgi:hypothetical protein